MNKILGFGFIFFFAIPGIVNTAQAQTTTLTFAHFWPEKAPIHKLVFQRWANAVESQSNGQLKIDIQGSQKLAKAPATYNAVKTGSVDIGATVLGYMPNRFPLSQIIELPNLVDSAVGGSCTIQTLFDNGLLKSEFQDTKVLFLFTHGPGHIHSVATPILKPQDLTGLKIRRPTKVVEELLNQLGATSVSMPAPKIKQALQGQEIDGAMLPWEGVHGFGLNKNFKYHTQVSLYSVAFIVTMNKKKFNNLSSDLKQVINQNAGLMWAEIAGRYFDATDILGIEAAKRDQHEITTVVEGAADPHWGVPLSKVTQEYIWRLALKDLPATTIYNQIIKVSNSICGNQ